MHKRLASGVPSFRRDFFDAGNAWSTDGSAEEGIAKRRLAVEVLAQLAGAAMPVDELLKEQVALQKLFIENCRSMAEQYETMGKEVSECEKENAALREENQNLCAALSDSSTSCGDQVKMVSLQSGLRELARQGEKPRPRKSQRFRTPRDKMHGMTLPGKIDDETCDNYCASWLPWLPKATKVESAARAEFQIRRPSTNSQNVCVSGLDRTAFDGEKTNSQNENLNGHPRSPRDIRPPLTSPPVFDDISESTSFDDTEISETQNTMRMNLATQNTMRMSLAQSRNKYADDEEAERMRKRFEGNPLFPDNDTRKKRMKEDLYRRQLTKSTQHQHHRAEFFQAIATHTLFESATLVVIVVSSVWLSIDTDLNKASYPKRSISDEAHPAFIFADNFFCTLFAVELFIRFMSFRSKVSCFKDGWFVFDSMLVFVNIAETWVLPGFIYFSGGRGVGHLAENSSALQLLRLLRLSRMARIVRLLRAIPELMVMMKAIGIALRSVAVTFALLFIIIYVFSIALTILLEDTPFGESKFSSVPEAMNTLFLDGILPDHSSLVHDAGDVHWVFFVILTIYLLLASITLLNMLVGILCEVVSVVASEERERLLLHFVHTELLELLKTTDAWGDGNGLISKQEGASD